MRAAHKRLKLTRPYESCIADPVMRCCIANVAAEIERRWNARKRREVPA